MFFTISFYDEMMNHTIFEIFLYCLILVEDLQIWRV